MLWRCSIRFSDMKELYAVYLGYRPASFWAYLKESIIEGFLGWVPGIIGVLVRNLGYRFVLKKMGRFSMILKGVDLRGCSSISLDEKVKLRKYMSIRVFYSHNTIKLGRNSSVHEYSIIKSKGGDVFIGENTFISSFVNISAVGNIYIGKNVMLANGCRIETGTHGFGNFDHPIKEQLAESRGINIEDDCWLGAGVKVVDNVTIGQGSVIGAGSVVTKNLPPYSIAAGVPARLIKKRRVTEETRL